MSGFLSKHAIHISSPLMCSEKQGIVTILQSDQTNSLRRTLSADMSSKRWLAHHGLSPAMKKIASSDKISVSVPDSSSSSEGEGDSDIWRSVREENPRKETENKPLPVDDWSSILTNKAEEEASKSLLPPYIHPLVKRSASFLSEKSLEICTESLGSETGSDGFSSYPPSESGDETKDEEESEEEKEKNFSQSVKMAEVIKPVKFNQKKSPSGPFPPPLPWLSSGASVRVQSHRENGRLTLEAVYFPSQSNFLSHRQDGRLVLSFADYEQHAADLEEEEEEIEENPVSLKDQEEEKTKTMKMDIMMENGVINVHRLALMVKRQSGLANNRLNEEIKSEEEEEVVESLLKKQLSPPLTTSIVGPPSLNAYEYYWRSKALAFTKPTRQENPSSVIKNSSSKLIFTKNSTENEQKKQFIALRGNKGDDQIVHFSKRCKEPRKSLLFWEPYCIATS